MPKPRRFLRRTTFILIAILSITIFNIYYAVLYGLPTEPSSAVSGTGDQIKPSTHKPLTPTIQESVSKIMQKPASTTTQQLITSSTKQSTSTTTQNLVPTTKKQSVSTSTQKKIMTSTHKLATPSTKKSASTSTQKTITTSTHKLAIRRTKKSVSKSTRSPTLSKQAPLKGNITLYELVKDKRYHYEFRYDLDINDTNDDPRLMILLNGSRRTCVDYWEFPVGRRILAALRSFRFLILAICSKRQKFDTEGPVQTNSDVKWIYLSLQKWMNDVYYKQFQRYPRLFIHGVSRGSKLAALLCRVLPIQGIIFTIYPGHREGLLAHSDHPIELQTRLQLDPVFANWFYFDFCYKTKMNGMKISDLCPFQNNRNNYQPVPPLYFIHLQRDPFFKVTDYTSIIQGIQKDAVQLGGALLNHTQAVTLYILPALTATPTYLQKTFDLWNSKPYASAIFYETFIGQKKYKPQTRARRTCLCLPIDFRYYELYPNITKTWSKRKQDEYNDYARDVKQFEKFFCEDVCGDLFTHHAISSRGLDKALSWINEMDQLRHSFYIKDYLMRPLRIWMYDKDSIATKVKNLSSIEPIWNNMSKAYQMYSPEYYLQDYFQQLKASSTFPRHNLQWVDNPLLADYFLIPNDLMFYYFYSIPINMTAVQFHNISEKLNKEYFTPLLTNMRTNFPYWTMTKREDQIGSNHIIAMLNGRNMGYLYNDTQLILKNVIQLVFTGIRKDMLPPDTRVPYGYRGTMVVYRHGYDVVLPEFTGLKLNQSIDLNINMLSKKKKRLFYFAGALDHATTSKSARGRLSSLWKDIMTNHTYNVTTEIEGKQFDTITIVAGHVKPDEYIESIQSSVFSLCPEGFLPWSPRLYEAIQIGAIPIIMADSIVLPFERFIDWQSFSVKINVSNIGNMSYFVSRIDHFEEYIKQKLSSAQTYVHAFQWPYSDVGANGQNKHVFLPDEDSNGSARNVFHYMSLELRCRRLEQLYGLTSDSFSAKSMEAQQQACRSYPSICPCHNAQQSVAFREYI